MPGLLKRFTNAGFEGGGGYGLATQYVLIDGGFSRDVEINE